MATMPAARADRPKAAASVHDEFISGLSRVLPILRLPSPRFRSVGQDKRRGPRGGSPMSTGLVIAPALALAGGCGLVLPESTKPPFDFLPSRPAAPLLQAAPGPGLGSSRPPALLTSRLTH